MPNSEKLTAQEANAVLDAGVDMWHSLVDALSSRGLDIGLGSSVLAVTMAGAMTGEGIDTEQLTDLVRQTLRLWCLDVDAMGDRVVSFRKPWERAAHDAEGN